MPKKQQGWITFQSSDAERQLLEQYCQHSERSKTDVLRELVRGLASQLVRYGSQSSEDWFQPTDISRPSRQVSLESFVHHLDYHAMKVSARNALKGKVTRVEAGAVNTEVTLEVASGVEITAIITKTSAEQLGLVAGKDAYAVIKSSDVMIAVD
jgi:molybdopterin-binding protein